MKKILVDLNIILDFLNKRNFHLEAAQLVDMCVEKKLAGYMCAHERFPVVLGYGMVSRILPMPVIYMSIRSKPSP